MTINDVSTCPKCGGALKYYDKVRRIIRMNGGVKHWINVKRFRCSKCCKTYRKLPEYIFPYKHYDARIIKAVLTGSITSDTLGFEDYPCEMTIKRWTRK